jgi:hypothetical protein
MYCPNCGNKTSTDQKFCRTCGLGLEESATSLIRQRPTDSDSPLAKKDRMERWGKAASRTFILIILSLFLFAISYLFMHGFILGGSILLGMLILVSVGLLSVFLFEKAKAIPTTHESRNLSEGQTTKELLSGPSFEPASSITEQTTEPLRVQRKESLSRK